MKTNFFTFLLIVKSIIGFAQNSSIYNSNLIQKKIWNYDTAHNMWSIYNIYDYSKINNDMEETLTILYPNVQFYSDKNIYHFNPLIQNDSLIEQLKWVSYKGLWEKTSIRKNKYQTDSLLSEFQTGYWDGLKYNYDGKSNFRYLNKNKIVEEDSTWFAFQWQSSWLDSFFYDSDNKLYLEKVYDKNSVLVRIVNYYSDTLNKVDTIYTYDKQSFGPYWDSTLLVVENKFSPNLIIKTTSYWDTSVHRYVPGDSSIYGYTSNKQNSFRLVFYNYQNIWARHDSIHYYYFDSNCYPKYEIIFDNNMSTFNLILDSITILNTLNFKWDFGDGTSSNLKFPSHYYSQDTSYYLCLTIYKSNGDSCTYCHIIGKDYQGHIIKSAGFNLNVKGQGNIGVNEIGNEKPELVVYPNPVSNHLTVYSKQFAINKVEIKNILGQVIEGNSPLQRGLGGFEINVSNLPTGVYFVKATDEKGNTYNVKFVKK